MDQTPIQQDTRVGSEIKPQVYGTGATQQA